MSSLKIDKEKRIHTRDIKIATYAYDDAHIIVEGELNDNRIIANFSHKNVAKRLEDFLRSL